MVDVLKTCMYILNHEPEEWLNFSAGQNFKFNLERYKSYSEISGKFLRILIFIRWFFYRFNPFKSILKKQMEVDIYIYASSINQISVLDQAKNILIERKVKVMPVSDFLISKEFSHRFCGWEKVYFNFQTLIISIILTLRYIFPLLNRLKKIDKPITWLVLTEGWCGDAAQTLPIINKIAKESDLIIYSDGFKSSIDKKSVLNLRDYLMHISGFKSVTLKNS